MDFYGLGRISFHPLKEETPLPPQKNHEFICLLNGDRNGILLLATNQLPLESDLTCGLEMLNVLAARIVEQLHREGIELIMSAPVPLETTLRTRLENARVTPERFWAGQFDGRQTFQFEVVLITGDARSKMPGNFYFDDLISTIEEKPCSGRSLV